MESSSPMTEAAQDFATRSGLAVTALADPLLEAYTADGWTAAIVCRGENEKGE